MPDSHVLITLAQRLVLLFVVTNMLALGHESDDQGGHRAPAQCSLEHKGIFGQFRAGTRGGHPCWCELFHLEHGYALGLILLATAAGDPFVTKDRRLAKGDPAYTVR